jgi:addiction module HigA family antidote
VSYPRVNEIVNGKRGITPDTALRLAKLFGTTAEFWLNGQRNWDLWHAMHSQTAEEIDQIEPVSA